MIVLCWTTFTRFDTVAKCGVAIHSNAESARRPAIVPSSRPRNEASRRRGMTAPTRSGSTLLNSGSDGASQKQLLCRLIAIELANDAATAHDQHTVGETDNFLKL